MIRHCEQEMKREEEEEEREAKLVDDCDFDEHFSLNPCSEGGNIGKDISANTFPFLSFTHLFFFLFWFFLSLPLSVSLPLSLSLSVYIEATEQQAGAAALVAAKDSSGGNSFGWSWSSKVTMSVGQLLMLLLGNCVLSMVSLFNTATLFFPSLPFSLSHSLSLLTNFPSLALFSFFFLFSTRMECLFSTQTGAEASRSMFTSWNARCLAWSRTACPDTLRCNLGMIVGLEPPVATTWTTWMTRLA